MEHQTSLKVPNGGTMSGALPDGREEREREEEQRSSYHQYPFSRGTYEQAKRGAAKLRLRALEHGLSIGTM